jgi:hypothetical protein
MQQQQKAGIHRLVVCLNDVSQVAGSDCQRLFAKILHYLIIVYVVGRPGVSQARQKRTWAKWRGGF